MKPIRGAVFLLAACVLSPVLARAADNNWTNPAGGNWEDGANWSLGRFPQVASNDAPQIGVSGTYTVTVGSSAVNTAPQSLTNVTVLVTTFGSGTPTLDINYTNAATFRVNNTFDVGTGVANWNATNGLFSAQLLRIAHVFGTTGAFNLNAGSASVNFLHMGGTGRNGILNINTNASLAFIFSTDIGSQAGGNAQINIHGGGLYWSNTGYIGSFPASTGTIMMTSGFISMPSNGHEMNIGGVPTINGNGAVGRVIISNGVWNTVGFVNVGAGNNTRGEMSVYGGTLTNVTRPLSIGHGASATGSVLIAGSGVTWHARSSWIVGNGAGSHGSVTISNGLMRMTDANTRVHVGVGAGSRGELNLAGGSMLFTDPVGSSDPLIEVGAGSDATGMVRVTGGLYQSDGLSGGLIIATNTGSMGLVTLEGGIVRLRNVNVGSGGVLSNRTGGVLQFMEVDNVLGAGAKIVDGGTLSYRGYGALNVTSAMSKFSIVSGSILQLESSTNVNLAGTYTLADSAGSFKELSLTGNGTRWQSDALQVGAGTRLLASNAVNARVNSDVTSDGTILVQDSTVTFEKNLTVNGRYISDPSTNTFNSNVTVNVSGTLEGGVGDLFDFKKNLSIHSTNNNQFNLSLSMVSFSGGGDHTNAVTGGDFGTNGLYTAGNFGYGGLRLAAGDDLYFVSGGHTNGGATANALYINHLMLANNDTNFVSDLHSTFNIYYLLSEHQAGNAYLNDQSYLLDGGGWLMPVIPEPTTIVLLIACGAVLLRNRRQ